MIYHFEALKINWNELRYLRYKPFPHLTPTVSYYGNKIKIPFSFPHLKIDDQTTCTYQMSIKEGRLVERIIVLGDSKEYVQNVLKISEKDAKKLADSIILGSNEKYFFLLGESVQDNTNAVRFLVDKRSDRQLNGSIFKNDFQTKILLKQVDVKNNYTLLQDSEILLCCYADGFTTLAYPKGKNIELQHKTFNIFMDLFEQYKLELLINL